MPVNTAVHRPMDAIEAVTADTLRAPIPALELTGWKPRHLLSTFSDRRSLRKIGGVGAYLTQVRWSLWWALRR